MVLLKVAPPIPEIWPVEHQQEIEAISIATETEAILVERANRLVAEIHKVLNQLLTEDNQPQQLLIETVQEEMLLQMQLQQGEEPAEPILQAQPTEADLNTAIRNIKTAREILRKPDILVLTEVIPVVQHKVAEIILQDNLTIKDLLQPLATLKTDRVIRDPTPHKVRAGNTVSQHKLTLVLLTQTETLVPPIVHILLLPDLILPAPILLQAEAIVIRQAEVVVQEVPEEA